MRPFVERYYTELNLVGPFCMMKKRGLTLVELLAVVGIIAVLTALMFPVFSQAKRKASQTVCSSNMRQIGQAMSLYMADFDDRMPNRRDLKESLPGGYRPWTSWPPSDPRVGWAVDVFPPYIDDHVVWSCPDSRGTPLGEAIQVMQPISGEENAPAGRYWLWRFDRPDEPVPLDNFWGKTEWQAVQDLRVLNNPMTGRPESPAEVEMVVDPYFPRTIPTVEESLRGKTAHFRGRNRSFLDGHVKFLRDPRT